MSTTASVFDDFTPAMGSCLPRIHDDVKAINPDLRIAFEHIHFLKDYIDWFDGTTTVREPSA